MQHRVWCRRAMLWCRGGSRRAARATQCCGYARSRCSRRRRATRGVVGAVVGLHGVVVGVTMPRAVLLL